MSIPNPLALLWNQNKRQSKEKLLKVLSFFWRNASLGSLAEGLIHPPPQKGHAMEINENQRKHLGVCCFFLWFFSIL